MFKMMCLRPIQAAFFACSLSAAGAADGPEALPHPHKVYIDTKENKLFWPMDKPFWVRLAASPDPDAPSFLLQRVAPESDISTEKYNKEGIALEIQGKQFIRWYNYVTKQTVYLQFFTDGDAPATKAECSGAPTAVVQQRTFYGKGLHCSLTSTDELSGVETTFLSQDEQPYKPYTGPLTLDKQADVILRYYAVDHVGYAETPAALRFTVDLTPPTTTHVITGNAISTVLSTQAKFRITSTDTQSGVAGVHARLDNQEFKTVTDSEVGVDALPDGEHSITYYAVDRVDNRETDHTVSFYLDRTPPVVTSQVAGDLYLAPNGTRYISGRSHLQLAAEDNKSGVEQIVYAYDGVKFQPYSQPVAPPAQAGPAKVSYRASDKLGNTSTVATLPYLMDLATPQTKSKVVGPSYQLRSDFYITKESRIELTATDDASGVKQIESQLEDAPQPAVYTAPLAFPQEGRRLLRFWATDRVNNRELDQALVLITDNTPPEIFANFSLAATSKGADSIPVYRRQTSLFLGATDNASGVRKIFYSVDGGKEIEYKTPLVFEREGTVELVIRAEDNVGNQSTKRLRFIVKG